MPKEVTKNILTNVITAVAMSVIGGFGLWFNAELETYKEMKAALPEIKEINVIREQMEEEYADNKQKVSADIWKLKERTKKIDYISTVIEQNKSAIYKLKQQRSKDSSHIYWNYSWVKHWSKNE